MAQTIENVLTRNFINIKIWQTKFSRFAVLNRRVPSLVLRINMAGGPLTSFGSKCALINSRVHIHVHVYYHVHELWYKEYM